MKKMANAKTQEMKKTTQKEIRMNVNFLDLVKKIKTEKLEAVNKEKLAEIYEQEMGLTFSNIERVTKRTQRKELNQVLSVLLKERDLALPEFQRITKILVDASKEKKNNYVSVKV